MIAAATAPLTVLIVDDELTSRQCVRMLLAEDPEVVTVGEAADATAALAAVEALRPDLMFLDVQMPEVNGFELLGRMREAERPVVVFSTAYGQYALRAFDVHGADYLVKPFTDARFRQALDHAKRLARTQRPATDPAEPVRRLRQFSVRVHGDRTVLVPVAEVEWIAAARDYVRIHSRGRAHLVRGAIGDIEAQLDPAEFVRVHRTCLVRVRAIVELRRAAGGALVVALPGGVVRRVSRRGRVELRRALGPRF